MNSKSRSWRMKDSSTVITNSDKIILLVVQETAILRKESCMA